jgi:hypothetical protein
MTPFICKTCCVEYAPSDVPPEHCVICTDERQYVAPGGQHWTSFAELAETHASDLRDQEPGLLGVGVIPFVGIGQRALLIDHPEGGVLWDCVPYLDDRAAAEIADRGGVRAIAISHPHFYAALVSLSEKLGGPPVYLHEADADWVMRPDPRIRFWSGETHDLGHGLTLIRSGGHFAGSTMLHWPAGAEGTGALLTGDTMMVTPDTSRVSWMRSYPNLVPLPPDIVRRIVAATEPFAFDRIYAAWWDRVMQENAKANIDASERRYVEALEGRF